MGITIKGKKNPETYKMISALCSYMFEQECGELRHATKQQIETLNKAKQVLGEIANN